MRSATLKRYSSSDEGTFGKLAIDTGLVLFTAELPWRDNARLRSCIPPGRYQCDFRHSEKFGDCYHVEGVAVPWHPSWRTAILIHAGNWAGDTQLVNPATGKRYLSDLRGCIAVGTDVGNIKGQAAVKNSADALRQLAEAFARAPFELTIV